MFKQKILFVFISLILVSSASLTACSTPSTTTTSSNTGELKVLVFGEGAVPLAGVSVNSNAEPGGQKKVTGITNSDGIVIYANIISGEYVFHINKVDYEQAAFNVSILIDKTTTVTVNLVRASTTTTSEIR